MWEHMARTFNHLKLIGNTWRNMLLVRSGKSRLFFCEKNQNNQKDHPIFTESQLFLELIILNNHP
jgi:hypothetical protein